MDIVTYALLKKKIQSLTSGIKSVSVDDTRIIFVMNDGTTQHITIPIPADGVSITGIDINANNHLICTMSDGTSIDAGEIPTIKGDKGFSPTITENSDNTGNTYRLDITDENGTFTTPNLIGSSKELHFKTRLEFPAIGSEGILYIATDENLIYRFDAVSTSYISLGSGDREIANIKVIQSIL